MPTVAIHPLDKKVERVFDGGLNLGPFLLDGFVAGAWCTVEKAGNSDDRAPSTVPLDSAERTDLIEEAEQLVRFGHPSAVRHEVVTVSQQDRGRLSP